MTLWWHEPWEVRAVDAGTPIIVSTERRQCARLHTTLPALICVGDGVPMVPCTILDISLQGGQVRLDATASVPDNFVLLLTKTGTVRRDCRVVWRRDSYLGVEFAGRFNRA